MEKKAPLYTGFFFTYHFLHLPAVRPSLLSLVHFRIGIGNETTAAGLLQNRSKVVTVSKVVPQITIVFLI
jgi:hypothetical protein